MYLAKPYKKLNCNKKLPIRINTLAEMKKNRKRDTNLERNIGNYNKNRKKDRDRDQIRKKLL